MIQKSMLDLLNFEREYPEGKTWKEPFGVLIFRQVETTPEERASGIGVRKRVPITTEEGIEIILGLERELWKAREAGTWSEDEDYGKFIEWNEVILSGIGACPMCSGCEDSGINKEIERRRAADPEISEHFRKIGVDLDKINREHRDA